MPHTIRRSPGALLATAFAALLASCGESGAGPEREVAATRDAGSEATAPAGDVQPAAPLAAPERVRLFDLMARAELTGFPAAGAVERAAERTVLDFDAGVPSTIWLATADGPRVEIGEEPASGAAPGPRVVPDAGLAGAALVLGPGLPDRSAAVLLVPARGGARVVVRGRVRLDGNPSAAEGSSREVLRVVEHARALDAPADASRRERYRAPQRRVSRSIDPNGWDRFEASFVSAGATEQLEVQLLHRSGDADSARTLFDDVEVEVTELSPGDVLAELATRYRPRDGQEEATPWRLRVPLGGRGKREVRDAVLLPPPARIAFPLRIPEAASTPRLRLALGMLPEALATGAVGARLEVSFEGTDGESVALAELAVDPRADRDWRTESVDLTPVAGRTGELVLAAKAEAGSDEETADGAFAPLVVATPRIEPSSGAPAALNVLLVGVDTLRADRMSAFGYERPTTPNLERLALEGAIFASARSQAPWTLPSFSSILTSLYPSTHGAGRGGHDEWTAIDPTTTALAEVLARYGYETHGIVANGLISPDYGLDQGFDGYAFAWAMESAEDDSQRVADFVREHTTTPWLLFWHVMDPHLPYSTDESFRAAFTDASYAGRFAGTRRPSVPFQVLDPRPGRRWYVHEGPPPAPELDEADVRFVNDYYDAEIAEMDAALGVVLAALEESGQWERTIVALVADHGEGLGDHGHYHHGYTLFEDQVHVPMLVRVPGAEARVVERPVATIDLAPTLLGALGLPTPASFQGVDRLAADAPEDDAYFIEYPTYDSSAQKAWVLGRFKYLHDPVFRTQALYDLAADPGERRDVAAEHPAIVARARAELDAFRWEKQQKGRFHLRVRGRAGQRLVARVSIDDLFDANFACRPMRPETDFTLDLERQHLVLDTTLERDRLELVFWGRGGELGFDVQLDGAPLARGLGLGGEDTRVALDPPARLERGAIPVAEGGEVGWPGPGEAYLWLETGVGEALPVVPTPEEIEVLQQLGYAR